MSTSLPLEKMSIEEKLRLMESLWEDLSRRAADLASPGWHGAILAEREAVIEGGDDAFEDLSEEDRGRDSVRIRILAAAHANLIDGYRFDEKQAAGVGRYFLDTLYSDIQSLTLSAGIHPIHFGKFHRLLSKRFPFAVYYRVEADIVSLYASSTVAGTPPGSAIGWGEVRSLNQAPQSILHGS